MAEAGWYTDPYDSSRLRYWDGAQWTEHTHDRPQQPAPSAAMSAGPSHRDALSEASPPREESPPGRETPGRGEPAPVPGAGPTTADEVTASTDPPPFAPQPEPDPGLPTARPGHLNDIGQWLQRSFKIGLVKLPHCALLIILGLVPGVFFFAVAFLALSEISVDGGGVQGASMAMFFLVGLLFLVWMLWNGVITLAQNDLLYHAHVGRPSSIGESIQAGLQGLGRLVWAYLTLMVYVIMVIAVVGGLTFVLSLASDIVGGVFFVVAYLGAIVLSVWLGVKLIFLLVAAAVAPVGERPIVVSVDITDGFFWSILGRVLLLGLITMAGFVPVMAVFGGLFAVVAGSFSDDPGAGTATALTVTAIVGFVLYLLVMLSVQVFSTSGIVRLYVDLGGPARELS